MVSSTFSMRYIFKKRQPGQIVKRQVLHMLTAISWSFCTLDTFFSAFYVSRP